MLFLMRLNVSHRVEQLPHIMLTAPVVFPAQQQIRQHKLPLFIRNIGPVRPTNNLAHHSMLAIK